MILLFNEKETEFNNNGLGSLNDAVTCEASEELNGSYELEMTYPIDGVHYSDIGLGLIIYTKANAYQQPQPFRIYSISKPINRIVTVNAEHISYDLSGLVVKGREEYYAWYAKEVFDHIRKNALSKTKFTFETNVETKGEICTTKPRTARSYLGTSEGILSAFGGEYVFDMYSVKHVQTRGADRGVHIEYGKNLTDLKQEENNSEMYTAVYPFYYADDDGLQTLDDSTVEIIKTPIRERVLPLDLSDQFTEMPTKDELIEKAKEYITKNKLDQPKVALTVSFVKIKDDLDYMQDVRLGDTVMVKFPKLGVDSSSRCISYKFNCITEKYNSIELGEPESTLVETVSTINSTANKASEKADEASDKADEAYEKVGSMDEDLQDVYEKVGSMDEDFQDMHTKVGSMDKDFQGMDEDIQNMKVNIDQRVIKGEVCSEINMSPDAIELRGNRLIVESSQFVLDAAGNAVFSGQLNAASGSFSGAVTATSGYIGPFEITTNGLEWIGNQSTKIWGNIVYTDAIIGSSDANKLHVGNSNTGVELYGAVCVMEPGSSTAEANTRIQNNTNRLAVVTSSSQRYKHDIAPVFNPELDPNKLYDVEVMQYKYNLDYTDQLDQRHDTDVIGFIAEDIYNKYPIAAEVNSDGTIENWNARYMIPPMLKLIQNQHKEIDELKMELITLKNEFLLLNK